MTRIEALSKHLGWRQARMAEYLGLSQPSVSRLWNGSEEHPAARKLLDLLALESDRPDLTAAAFDAARPDSPPGAGGETICGDAA